MKDKIEEALKVIGLEVFYGIGRFKDRELWDCIVYGKRRTQKSDNGKDRKQRWFVAIVKEDEVPEGMEKKVADELRKIGLKQTIGDVSYEYVEKSGECMVEICMMEFCRIEKGCA